MIKPMKADIMPVGYEPCNNIVEQKYDGHRMMLHVRPPDNRDSYKIESWSSQCKPSNRKLSLELMRILTETFLPGIYDGELHLTEPGSSSSDVALIKNKDKLCYTVFDLLGYYDNDSYISIMHRSLIRRKKILEVSVMNSSRAGKAPYIRVYSIRSLTEFIEAMFKEKHEGAIIKDVESIYEPGKRRKTWLKVKQCKHITMRICNYTEPTFPTEFGIMWLVSEREDVRTSVKVPNLKLRELFLKESQVDRKVIVEFQDMTVSGLLRHPRFDRFVDE